MPLLDLFRSRPLKPYQYPDLNPYQQSFRVFRLLPPRPSVIPGCLGTIRIEVFPIAADSETGYDALSYVWNTPIDDSGPDRRIIVETTAGSFDLRIYPSLELALHRLFASGGTTRPIFADQISINQSNAAEKGSQVQLMKVIYSRCVRTVVCLGPSTRASDRYFDYVNEINLEGVLSRVMGPRKADFGTVFDAVMSPNLEVTPDQRKDRDDLLRLVKRFGPSFPLAGFADVLDRRWFNRLWTIQEVCLAPAVIFLCGTKTLSFDDFRAGALFYSIYNTHWIRNLDGPCSRAELQARNDIFGKQAGFTRIFQERKAIHTRAVRQSFYELVLKYNVNDGKPKLGATLSQDRIFGLLGLVDENDCSARRLSVSYRDVVRTYTEVAALMLEHTADALLFSQFPKKTENLPSWVPDWATDLTIPISYSALKTPMFSAGIGPQQVAASFAVDLSTRELSINGILVDTVVDVGLQTYEQATGPQVMPQVDYRSAKRMFDEIAQFVRVARGKADGKITHSSDRDSTDTKTTKVDARPDDDSSNILSLVSSISNQATNANDEAADSESSEGDQAIGDEDEAVVIDSSKGDQISTIDEAHAMCLRVCDSGFCLSQLTNTLGTAALARLSYVHASIDTLGQRLIASDETINAHRISRIFSSNISTTRLKSLSPRSIIGAPLACLAAAKEVCERLVASARVTFAALWIRFRRRFRKVNLRPSREYLANIGVDPDVAYGQDTSAFTTGLLRNQGRRVFRTESGFVGMGPWGMRAGDRVVVFRGCAAAHVLRGVATSRPEERFELVGEAYCDGMMEGQALDLADKEREFILV